MHSSTSNSKERVPHGPWLRQWLLAIALLAIALAGWKAFWTAQGFGVSLPNDARAWGSARTWLRPETTVLVGTSRMQVGLVPEEWAAASGGDVPLKLSLVGTSPAPLLTHIAEDTDFRGLLVFGVVEMFLFDADATNYRASEALAEYRSIMGSPSRRAGVHLGRYVPGALLVRHQALALGSLVEAMWERRAPRNPVSNMRADRWIEFDARRMRARDTKLQPGEEHGRAATVAERDSIIADIAKAVTTIQARGGRVVLVAMPACGARLEVERRRYPRADYWDALAAGTTALAINAYDFPELLDFTCADGSHLNAPDARRFSRRLARLIQETE